ncbi:hypothetical protein GOV06_00365 [Candidatus Woesearchaeota archaeon]|nr:hypothetical protein [Candidatus Woesearchaeota archaeon]
MGLLKHLIGEVWDSDPGAFFIAGYFALVTLGIFGYDGYHYYNESKELKSLEQMVSTVSRIKDVESEELRSIETHLWNPVDVTYKIKDALRGYDDEVVFLPKPGQRELAWPNVVSPNGKYWISDIVRGNDRDYLSESLLCSKHVLSYELDTVFLFDGEHKRIYALDLGDEKKVKYADDKHKFCWAKTPQVGDNGVCGYTIEYPLHSDARKRISFAYVVADPVKRRKNIVYLDNTGEFLPTDPECELSEDGGKVVMETRYRGLFEFDVEKQIITEVEK